MNKNKLLDKTFACLAAGAVGDAMGAPVEGWHYTAIREKYGVVDDLIPDFAVSLPGRKKVSYQCTDDTVLRNLIVKAIVKRKGRITAYDLAETWLAEMDPAKTNYLDMVAFMKLASGFPPREVGEGLPVCISATLGIAPIGIVNACDPQSAALDAFDVASLSQWREGKETAMAIAAGVAEAFRPDATVESIIEASKKYSSPMVAAHIDKAIQIARKYKDPLDVIPEYYEKALVPDGWEKLVRAIVDLKALGFDDKFSVSCHALEAVPVALGMFYLSGGNALKAMIGSVNYGRDCDGIAGFAGCLAGALNGSKEIPEEMVNKVNKANNFDLKEIAQQMLGPIRKVMEEKATVVFELKSIMG